MAGADSLAIGAAATKAHSRIQMCESCMKERSDTAVCADISVDALKKRRQVRDRFA